MVGCRRTAKERRRTKERFLAQGKQIKERQGQPLGDRSCNCNGSFSGEATLFLPAVKCNGA